MNFRWELPILTLIAALSLLCLCASSAPAAMTPLSAEPFVLTPDALAAQDFEIADLNGDGFLDIAVGCYNAPNVVYLNTFGDFSGYTRWESAEADYTLSLALADVSGSGPPDVFAGNSIGQNNR